MAVLGINKTIVTSHISYLVSQFVFPQYFLACSCPRVFRWVDLWLSWTIGCFHSVGISMGGLGVLMGGVGVLMGGLVGGSAGVTEMLRLFSVFNSLPRKYCIPSQKKIFRGDSGVALIII